MSNILIYFQSNKRAIDQQSVMELFVRKGHSVFLLTTSEYGELHRMAEEAGIKVFSHHIKKKNTVTYHIRQAAFLYSFCKKKCIDIVFVHLQEMALSAAIARPWLRVKMFYTRHNTDEGLDVHGDKIRLMNAIINRSMPKIIAPADKVYRYLVVQERVPPEKILRINYGYNFSIYLKTDRLGTAAAIRDQYSSGFLIVSVARLVAAKRHRLMFAVIESLLAKGMDVKMICIGDGELRTELDNYIAEKGLQKKIFLLGHRSNVLDYMEAADIYLHLSKTEASNSSVKESGLMKTPVVVCADVGDFDEYIETGKNGYLVSQHDPVEESIAILSDAYSDRKAIEKLGDRLYETVLDRFEISKLAAQYDAILS